MKRISKVLKELRKANGYDSLDVVKEKIEEAGLPFEKYQALEAGKFDREFWEQWQKGEIDTKLEDDLRVLANAYKVNPRFLTDPFSGRLQLGRLIQLMREKNWSDKQVANRLKWGKTEEGGGKRPNPATIGKWRRGYAVPSVKKLCQLAELFGVSADYLLGYTDYPEVVKLRGGKAWHARVIPLDEEGEKTVRLFERLASNGKGSLADVIEQLRDEGVALEFQDGLRLLKRALDNGFIRVEVGELDYDDELTDRLRNQFHVRAIIPKVSKFPKELAFLLLGEVAASFFAKHVRPGWKIALSGGTTIRRMVMSLKHYKGKQNLSGLKLFPMDVSPMSEKIDVHSNTLVGTLKYFFEENNAEAHGILNPGLLAPGGKGFWPPPDPEVRRVLHGARTADAVFVGIGAIALLGDETLRVRLEGEGYNIFYSKDLKDPWNKEGYLITKEGLDKARERDIRADELAVGDVLFHLLNIKGEELRHEFNERIPSIPLAELKHLAEGAGPVVGVAMGEEKATAVYAVLNGGYINTLIVDEALAKAIQRVKKEEERGRRIPPSKE